MCLARGKKKEKKKKEKQHTSGPHRSCLSHQRPITVDFTIKQGVTTIHEDSTASKGYSIQLEHEMEAVKIVLCWTAPRNNSQPTLAVSLTNSVSLLKITDRTGYSV